MRKLFLLLTMLTLALNTFSQTLSDANSLFEEGNYNEAKIIYYKYKSKETVAASRYKLCSTLEGYYSTAVDFYNAKKYNSALKVCSKIFDINPVCAKTKALEARCNNKIKELQEERQQKFDAACKSHSEERLKAFQKEYSNQSEWVAKANLVIKDLRDYKIAEQRNTREAYQSYIDSSIEKIYVNDAKYKIGDFDCHAMWENIKNQRNKLYFKEFIDKYSVYNYKLEEAKANIELLDAEEAAENSFWENAYAKFRNSQGKTSLPFTKDDDKLYHVATMVHEYNELGANATQENLISYMNKYRNSPCRDNASDRVALLKANELTPFSSVAKRNDAYSYAKTDEMKQRVQNILDKRLKEKREYNRKIYGPKVTVGIALDGAFYPKVYDAGVGLYVQIGRFNQIINGIIGVKYEGVAQYESSGVEKVKRLSGSSSESSSSDYKNFMVGHQLVIPVGLRFNLVKLSDYCSMYIGAKAEYGISSKGDLKSNMTDEKIGKVLKKTTFAYYPELGIHSHHWNFNLYYKIYSEDPFLSVEDNPNLIYLDKKIFKTNGYGGFTFAYYF